MIALIAGRGRLPVALYDRLVAAGETVQLCELQGQPSELDSAVGRLVFRLERLGGLVARLKRRGVTRFCMAGGVDRPKINPLALDMATLRLLPRVRRALAPGDDGALRAIISVFEGAGIQVVAATEIAPDLLVGAGCPTRAEPEAGHRVLAMAGDRALDDMGAGDTGQSLILGPDGVLATEGPEGTDALIGQARWPDGAVLFKGPKPGQDRRADMPTIGPATAQNAVRAGLDGIIVEAGGVIVLDQPRVVEILDAAGLFLWARERPA